MGLCEYGFLNQTIIELYQEISCWQFWIFISIRGNGIPPKIKQTDLFIIWQVAHEMLKGKIHGMETYSK
jgi:hypothetical protein